MINGVLWPIFLQFRHLNKPLEQPALKIYSRIRYRLFDIFYKPLVLKFDTCNQAGDEGSSGKRVYSLSGLAFDRISPVGNDDDGLRLRQGIWKNHHKMPLINHYRRNPEKKEAPGL